MKGNRLTISMVITFAMMLLLAMSIQSLVVLFLGVRASIRQDMAWSTLTLQSLSSVATFAAEKNADEQRLATDYERLLEKHNDKFTCIYMEPSETVGGGVPSCRFSEELRGKSRQAKSSGKPVVGFAGLTWNVFLMRSEVVLLAVPLINQAGQVIGTLSAERSLLPLYSCFEHDSWLAFFYLLVNVLIISTLWYFRIDRILFKPLEKLVQKTENYHPDQQSLLLFSDDKGAFRKLSVSLNMLLDRIERDNFCLRKTVTELEALNKELTERNELVVRSEKLASVGRLSAGLAHEIGNPLSIIQGYVALLSRDDLTGGEKKHFNEKAQEELDRIKRLIQQLLAFAGPQAPEVHLISVHALLHDVIDFIMMEKSFAGCILSTAFTAEHDKLVTDMDALRQVIINCLLNAADASAGLSDNIREIIVSSRLEDKETKAPKLLISIKDNGLGIPDAHKAKIFDPFFTTKEVGKGTGLGLFVSHIIMEKLGGSITLENRASVGVEVTLALPLQQK